MRGLWTKNGALIALFFVVPFFAYADHAVNINTAGVEELATLQGIGEVKAQNIIDYRETNGLFSAVEQIEEVSGIGPKTYEDIADHIVVEEEGGQEEEVGQQESVAPPEPAPTTERTEKRISADAGPDRTVAVGAPIFFSGVGYGFQGVSLAKADYVWNFGDGSRAVGEEKIHFYQHTGTYVVTLTVSAGPYTATDRAVVTATEPDFSITAKSAPVSLITIENKGTEEMDLSGWIITAGEQEFILPEHTIALPGTAIHIPKEVTYFAVSEDVPVVLHYPNGIIATSFRFPPQVPHRSVSSSVEEPEQSPEHAATSTVPAAVGTVSGSESGGNSQLLWWVAFGALVFLAAGATVFVRRGREYTDELLVDDLEVIED